MCLTIKHILFFGGNGQALSPALPKTLSPLPRRGRASLRSRGWRRRLYYVNSPFDEVAVTPPRFPRRR